MSFVMMILTVVAVSVQGPPPLDKLPPSRRVTDPSRIDYGFSPFAGSHVTVIVAFARDCQPCLESMPFYKRLSQLPVMDGKAGRLVFTAERAITAVQAFVMGHEHGFTPHSVITYPADDRLGITTLPSVLLYEGATQLRGKWTGPMTPASEREVLAAIDKAAKAGRKKAP